KTNVTLTSAAILALLAFLSAQLSAQSITGSITGTLVDPSGAAVPGADVTLTNEHTSETRNTATSETGDFVFAALQPGSYAMKMEKTGLRGFNRRGIVLTTSERLGLGRIQLEVGELTSTVNVTLEGETVKTESADTAAALSVKELEDIPAKGRDVMNLLRL